MASTTITEDLMEKGITGEETVDGMGDEVVWVPQRLDATDTAPQDKMPRSRRRAQNYANKAAHWIQHSKQTVRTDVHLVDKCLKGYPRLAALLDCDENFMVYRRFGYLQARLLLYKQDVLRELEDDLDRMDESDEYHKTNALRSREDGDIENPDKKKLFGEIEGKFKEYADLLIVSRELAGFTRPPARDYFSVKNYFDSQGPICNPESYIYRKEDIVTLKPGRENAWIDAFIEKILHKLSSPLIRYMFCTPDLRDKVDPVKTKIQLYSRDRINHVVGFIIMITILALLIIPVYVLLHVGQGARTPSMTLIMIMVLLLSTLIFSVVLTKFTSAKRHETLGAAATYCAVLVVFLGNLGNSSSGSSSGSSNGTST
ncbi:uncharacterized protein PAC_20067 [Phialocephala subalpina]|uniref:DUF6594 domain-containing protein n=1 Tax=Phialocephala subalpina TaxID=576137 RepID=A0A1L7XYX2_9HELO|nr:uncharacterized protein PAC_20067 [Phialocephala subalpina]